MVKRFDKAVLRRAGWLLASSLVLPAVFMAAQATDQPPVKKQLAADERAYRAARKINDPEQCLAAMRAFVKEYPKSSRVGRAQDAILTILLQSSPQQSAAIESQVKVLIKSAGKGQSRDREETDVAMQLAEAGSSGVDLATAEKLAKDAVDHLNEEQFKRDMLASYRKYKAPAPKAEEVETQYAKTRAEALSALADVYLREGKQAQSAALVSEAFALDPMLDDVNMLRGRLALADHNNELALAAFERAQLLGALSVADRTKTMELYKAAHGGSDAAFAIEMDGAYAKLFPASFTPEKPANLKVGHTVLLELFTGSGCPPCVGGDMAVEGLLEAYPRTEVVALAFDQHVPEPDPLTNPDSVARAELYDALHTPEYAIDGKVQQQIYGSAREGSHELYQTLQKAVDAASAVDTGIQLELSAAEIAGGGVEAHAHVSVPGMDEINKALKASDAAVASASATTEKAATGKDKGKPAPATGAAVAQAEPHLILNFALVEDDIRYSGENGIRFHRMVVRSLAKAAWSGFPVEAGGSATMNASFDPAAISASLVKYLDAYEEQNEKFGKIKFLTKDMTMRPDHLAIAAWVQDSVTRRVLQAAFVPVGKALTGTR